MSVAEKHSHDCKSTGRTARRLFVENGIAISLVAISAVALICRLELRDFISVDMSAWLLPWNDIFEAEGFSALSRQVGDYGIAYQFLMILGTFIPLAPEYYIKGISIVFDFLLAWQVLLLVKKLSKSKWAAVMAYALILMLPPFIMNSAMWGQCDSIFSTFIVYSLRKLVAEKYSLSFLMLGIALGFKLQAVFVFPAFLIYAIVIRKCSFLNFLLIPVGWYLTALPGFFFGRSLLAPIEIYLFQTGEYPLMYANCPSFWTFLPQEAGEFRIPAILLTLVILSLAFYAVISMEEPRLAFSPGNIMLTMTLLTWTCVEFLPSMHERYGFIVVTLLVVTVIQRWKKLTLWGILGIYVFCDCVTYSHFLLGTEVWLVPLSILMLLAWGAFAWVVFSQLRENAE